MRPTKEEDREPPMKMTQAYTYCVLGNLEVLISRWLDGFQGTFRLDPIIASRPPTERNGRIQASYKPNRLWTGPSNFARKFCIPVVMGGLKQRTSGLVDGLRLRCSA